MDGSLRISVMTADEMAAVDTLEQEVFGDTAAPIEFLMDAFDNHDTFLYVAYWNNELVGHCAMSFNIQVNQSYCNIGNMMVKSDFRGKGIGRRLMTTMLDKARQAGVERVTLKVAIDNDVAIEMYKSFGFQITERIANFYSDDGGDAYVMWCYLSPNREL